MIKDFKLVKGQEAAKRAIEIAVLGSHSILLYGPSGSGDGKIDAVAVRKSVGNRFQPSPPLIFINACRGGQLGTLLRQSFTFASEFLRQGAVCVQRPQIEVPAVFAGEFGNRFFTAFMQRTKPPPQAGLVLRDITREKWKHNNPFGLAYSLYAGADCHVRWDEQATA